MVTPSLSLSMASKLLLCVIIFLSLYVFTGLSQDGPPSCVGKLMPCQAYLKGPDKPTAQCCIPLKEAIDNDKPCLCHVFYNQALLKGFNLTQAEALEIVPKCGLAKPDLSVCTHNATDTPPVPSPPSPPAPATPSKTPSGSPMGTTPTGIIAMFSLLLAGILSRDFFF